MKNKFVWFLVLVLGVFGIILLSNSIDGRTLAGSINILNYTPEGYDELPLGMAIFMEAFCSIHMSVFVLMPLSKIFFKNNDTKAFIIMFVVRVIFLLIFNFISTYIAILDFMMVFFGAFIVVPVSAAICGTKINHRSNQIVEDNEITENFGSNDLGITDLEVLKKVLVMQYADINRAFYARDINKIRQLCSPGVYMDYKVKWEMYDKVLEIPKIEDVDFYDVEFGNMEKHGSEIFVDLYIKYTCLEYSVDNNNSIVRGNKDKYKMFSKALTFSKRQSNDIVNECPNCGARVRSDDENCEYCNTELNFKIGEWVLKSEKTIYEGIKE